MKRQRPALVLQEKALTISDQAQPLWLEGIQRRAYGVVLHPVDPLSFRCPQLDAVGTGQEDTRHRYKRLHVVQSPTTDHGYADARVSRQHGEQPYEFWVGVDVVRRGRKVGQRAVVIQEQPQPLGLGQALVYRFRGA